MSPRRWHFFSCMPIIRAALNFFFHVLSRQDKATPVRAGRKCTLTSSDQREPWKFNVQWSLVDYGMSKRPVCLFVSSAQLLGGPTAALLSRSGCSQVDSTDVLSRWEPVQRSSPGRQDSEVCISPL